LYENTKKRKLKNNTYIVKTGEDCYGIKFHRTIILSFSRDGWAFHTGGYFTKTTKARLNEFMPSGYCVSQKDFTWFIEKIGYETLLIDVVETELLSY